MFWRRRRQTDDEFRQEIEAHIAHETDRLTAEGLGAEEAATVARRTFGNVAGTRERHYRSRRLGWLDDFARDVRHSVRSLRRTPGFTAVAVATLAIGIAANAAVMGVGFGYVLANAPVPDAESLVSFRWRGERTVVQMGVENAHIADNARESGRVGGTFPIGILDQIRANDRALSAVAALASAGSLNMVANGAADVASGQYVSGNFFQTLGIGAALGRTLVPADDVPSASPVVVVSHQYWQQRFGENPDIAGAAIRINGTPFTVVGVAAAELRDVVERGFPRPPDILLPLAAEPVLHGNGSDSLVRTPAAWWLTILGRARPGATLAEIDASLAGVFDRWLAAEFPHMLAAEPGRVRLPTVFAHDASRGLSDPSREVVERLGTLGLIVVAILLIVCVNVSNLLLSRSVSRERELAARMALGASRGRVVRLLLTEHLLLAAAGGMAGFGGIALVERLIRTEVLQNARSTAGWLDGSTMAITIGLTLLAALLFGVVPAWRAVRSEARLAARGRVIGTQRRSRLGQGLLVAQIALSLPLLVLAGLFLQTLANLRDVDVGFDPRRLVLFTLEPELSGYDRARANALFQAVDERLLAIPGVQDVTHSAFGASLLDGGTVQMVVTLPGESRAAAGSDVRPWRMANMLNVAPAFFDVLGVPLVLGRGFTAADTADAPTVVVVNEAFARTYFPGESPIGKRFRGPMEVEIVGVAGDAKVHGLREDAPPTFYRSLTQFALPWRRIVVRATVEPETLFEPIRQALRAVDPRLPPQDLTTQQQRIDAEYLIGERMFARMSSAIGGVATLLVVIGVFGLTAYGVARRTREIGVRMALGAAPRDVLLFVTRETLGVACVGVVLGVGLVLSTSRFIDTYVFGVSPNDTLTIGAATVLVIAAATLAAWLPARRAARVDPVAALRSE